MKNFKLTDLISVSVLQQLQDGFSRYTGMAALTTDSDGIPVTTGSGFTHFCMDLTRQSEMGCMNCEECDKNGALLTLKNGHATVYDCHAGLCDFAAPIMVEGKFIGSFIGGQVRTEPVDEEKMRATAEKYGLDPDEYIKAAKETACLPKEEIVKAAQYLEEIASALSGMAYKSYTAMQKSIRTEKAAKSQAEYIMSMSLNIENNMKTWSDVIESTKENTYDDTLYELLSEIQNEGQEIRQNIGETIDYIRASSSKVEILKTDYSLDMLAQHIEDSISRAAVSDDVSTFVRIEEGTVKNLFGDAGRIGQLVSRISKSILERKPHGELTVTFSTHPLSYSTMLVVEIADTNSEYTEQELNIIRGQLRKRRHAHNAGVDNTIISSLEGALLQRIEGKYSVHESNGDFTITISIPQLELRGGDV